MVRLFQAIAVAALTVLAVLTLDARLTVVRADDVADCVNASGDTAIRGCSRIIKSRRIYGKPISKKNLAITHYNRGNAYRKKGEYDRAIADYDKAIKLNPKYANAYLNRGFIYKKKGQFDRAIADYSEAIKLNPKDASAYNNRGIAYRKKGEYDRAIADYDTAIKLNPKNAEAYFNRGISYGKKGEFDRAIADYDTVIKLNPKFAKAKFAKVYSNRGSAYGLKGNYDRAIADYDKAIKLNPKAASAYRNRGIAYGRKGDHDKGIADLRKAIELRPGDKVGTAGLTKADRQTAQINSAGGPTETNTKKPFGNLIGTVNEGNFSLPGWKYSGGACWNDCSSIGHDTYKRADGAHLALIKWSLPSKPDSKHGRSVITDVLFIPHIETGYELNLSCTTSEREGKNPDQRFIAVVRTVGHPDWPDWLRDVKKAWVVKMRTRLIEPASPNGVSCWQGHGPLPH